MASKTPFECRKHRSSIRSSWHKRPKIDAQRLQRTFHSNEINEDHFWVFIPKSLWHHKIHERIHHNSHTHRWDGYRQKWAIMRSTTKEIIRILNCSQNVRCFCGKNGRQKTPSKMSLIKMKCSIFPNSKPNAFHLAWCIHANVFYPKKKKNNDEMCFVLTLFVNRLFLDLYLVSISELPI